MKDNGEALPGFGIRLEVNKLVPFWSGPFRHFSNLFIINRVFVSPPKLWLIYKICFWFICLCLSKIKILFFWLFKCLSYNDGFLVPILTHLYTCLSHVEMRSYLKLWVFLTSLAFLTYVFCFNVHITKYKPDNLWANWSLIK